jgi:hypothetical protein
VFWFLFPFFSHSSFSASKAFSRDQSSFFGSSEVEKKLVFEVNCLKAELARQVELEIERQGCQVTKEALRAQVSQSERQKDNTLAALKEAAEKSDGFKRDCEGIRVLPRFFLLSLPIGFLTCAFRMNSSLEE